MDDGSPLYVLVIFIGFVVVNAMMYSFGAAIQNLNETELEKKAAEQSKKDIKLLKYLQNPAKLITTIHLVTGFMAVVTGYFQLGIYAWKVRLWLVSLGSGFVLSDAFMNFIAYFLTALYLMLLLLALGIFVPKKLGTKYSRPCAYALCGIVNVIVILLTPFTAFITFFSNLILRIIGIDPGKMETNVTEEEIINMVNEGHEQGILEEREAEMISNIFELDDKTAGDIMTHRKTIVAIDGDWTLKETVEFISEQNNSRYPVYADNIDNIIGILHIKDVLYYYHKSTYDDMAVKNITNLLRKPEFIPESRNLNDLFKEMQMNKNHMEIVVDEYGQTAGLVAMEDILEEIVGNIMDEHDLEENNIIREADDRYLVSGLTTLEEIEEKTGIIFDDDEFDTINGYLISKLDRIPAKGEKPEIIVRLYCRNGRILPKGAETILCDCTFRVLETGGKIISKLEIIKSSPEDAEPKDEE